MSVYVLRCTYLHISHLFNVPNGILNTGLGKNSVFSHFQCVEKKPSQLCHISNLSSSSHWRTYVVSMI